ncbi:archaeal proteasome endopeptidase complex subunit beta [Halococcus dombrowskii]|uniref:Proteasome subunit beta n=1 Tax=Halococcus dombrowskii TaxID=179637 RepID=A0AAX3APG7_HALDO|nr:archaeal proteasome endopeptidase complex subunit beta [Halococcus dombrowskii]UOO94880.1 archaeal proteasome endopeptidase complex subunit beta [Halococcus dombrowskii]
MPDLPDGPELEQPGRQATDDIYGPELGSLPSPDMDDAEITKTGTTTVGITTTDGVVLATDRRASAGNLVASKRAKKIAEIHPRGALTISGAVSAAQALISNLQAEVDLYEARRGEEMSMQALSTLTSNFLRSGAFYIVQPILGGVDEEGSHIYSIDPAGSVMEEEYDATGSGSPFAYGVLEQQYEDGLSNDEAITVAARAVKSAVERDTASGNGIIISEITEDGVEIEEHDDIEQLL